MEGTEELLEEEILPPRAKEAKKELKKEQKRILGSELEPQIQKLKGVFEEEFGFLLGEPKGKNKLEHVFDNFEIASLSQFKNRLMVEELRDMAQEEAEATGAFIAQGANGERIVIQELPKDQEREYVAILAHEAVHMLSPEPEVVQGGVFEDLPEGFKSVGLKARRMGPITSFYRGKVPQEYTGTLDEKMMTVWEPMGVGASQEEWIFWEAATDWTARRILDKIEPGYTPEHYYPEQSILTLLKVSFIEKRRLEEKEKELGRKLTDEEKEVVIQQSDRDFSQAVKESLVLGNNAFMDLINQIPKEEFLQRVEELKSNLEKADHPLAKRVPSLNDFSPDREDAYGMILDWVGYYQKSLETQEPVKDERG